jgi:TolB-like protein
MNYGVLQEYRSVLAVLLCLLLAPGYAGRAADGIEDVVETCPLAVLPFGNLSADARYDELGDAFAELLAVSLVERGMMVVDRTKLADVLAEQSLARVFGSETGRRTIGALTGAEILVLGSHHIDSGSIVIIARSVSAETSVVFGSCIVTGRLDHLKAVAIEVADSVCNTPLRGILANDRRLDLQPRANAAYAQGLGFFWSQRFGSALHYFLMALDMDPRHATARFWLAKCYQKMGRQQEALVELSRFSSADSGLLQQKATLEAICMQNLTQDEQERVGRVLQLRERSGLSDEDWELLRLPEWRTYEK